MSKKTNRLKDCLQKFKKKVLPEEKDFIPSAPDPDLDIILKGKK